MLDLKVLQKDLNYLFKNPLLLKQALTHCSYAKNNYERLEFIGDGILNYVIGLNLYNLYPNFNEGQLSKIRATLVTKEVLAKLANKLNIGDYLLLGEGEINNGGKGRSSILADALEAIFAAISLDSSFEQSKIIIENLYGNLINKVDELINTDSKTILQEYLQKLHLDLPIYEIIKKEGPEHNIIFNVACKISSLNINVCGEGNTKKEASQHAAQLALLRIKQLNKD